jgi:hypothetical protein
MKLDLTSSLLGIRALQGMRRLHLPTYVATRFLMESAAGKVDSSWAEVTMARKYSMRDHGRFHKTMKFKKIKGEGEYEYREYLVASPSTAISEALVLAHLGTSAAFSKPQNVYSYLWPKNLGCPYSFEHYVNGYKSRNLEIASFIQANRDFVLIVSDIEKFYPSIIRNRVRVKFNKAMRDGQIDKAIQETASSLLEHLFEGVDGERGIATGPELSHVIGDLALSEVDRVLSNRYPGAYFRYVDDIVLAVPAAEKNNAVRLLRELVGYEELVVHPDKTEIVSGSAWLDHGPHHSNSVKENSFESLVFLIKAYLLTHSDEDKSLEGRLKNDGFNIPIDRLARSGRSKSFANRFKLFKLRRWWVAMRAFVSTEQDVLDYSRTVRTEVLSSLERLLASGVPQGATRRRWFVQNLRYLTNRAFYLVPVDRLRFLMAPLSELPEFVETVALLKMLLEDDIEVIMKMPGAALLTGAGMLKQSGRKLNIGIKPESIDSVFVESLSTLLLFDVVSLDTTLFDQFDSDSQELLRFSSGQVPQFRVRDDFSYIDEMRCLQLFRKGQDNAAMIDSRFSDQEEVVFDALDIGGEYYN